LSFDRAADNSLSIETASTFTGGGCFDYMTTFECLAKMTRWLYQNRPILSHDPNTPLSLLKPNELIIINVYQNDIINTVPIDEF
jgi:hypothetical protein